MDKWARAFYQPCLPLGKNGKRITGCKKHIQLSREAASEGMVLLKNAAKVLPFAKGTRLALFGKGSIDYVKGGGGSGDVTCAYVRSLQDGLICKAKEGKVQLLPSTEDFYRKYVFDEYAKGKMPGEISEPKIPPALLEEAKAWTDTAVISICRFSGEGRDRRGIPGDGDFYLTKEEQEMVDTVTTSFPKVVVVLNVGGMVDTSWFRNNKGIPSVLLAWQGGMEGGLAAADILCGDQNPSGKLTDSFAGSFEDYPSSANFHKSEEYAEYEEDIYVGYRYFETIPGAKEKVNYPFGFGLSYTDFDIEPLKCTEKGGLVEVDVQVTNVGDYAGKEVVQLYYSACQGILGKPLKALGAFAKTRLLSCGESQVLRLKLPVEDMASYDDLGKISKSAYVLEAGDYTFWIGNSVRDVTLLDFIFTVKDTVITRQLSEKCAPTKLARRMLSDGSYEKLPEKETTFEKNGLVPQPLSSLEGVEPQVRAVDYRVRGKQKGVLRLEDVALGKTRLDAFLEQLSDFQAVQLLSGQPNMGVADTYGMGNLMINSY